MSNDVLASDLANCWTDIIPLYFNSCTSRENLKLFFGGFSTRPREITLKKYPPNFFLLFLFKTEMERGGLTYHPPLPFHEVLSTCRKFFNSFY